MLDALRVVQVTSREDEFAEEAVIVCVEVIHSFQSLLVTRSILVQKLATSQETPLNDFGAMRDP